MLDMAYNVVLSSGAVDVTAADVVRIFTQEAILYCTDGRLYYDSRTFWSSTRTMVEDDVVIALTTFLVLKWSTELEYQLD
jgi:hypothetical protein